MIASILDADKMLRLMSGEKMTPDPIVILNGKNHKPVSGAELIRRVEELFTPEEAEALASRIEEGRKISDAGL